MREKKRGLFCFVIPFLWILCVVGIPVNPEQIVWQPYCRDGSFCIRQY